MLVDLLQRRAGGGRIGEVDTADGQRPGLWITRPDGTVEQRDLPAGIGERLADHAAQMAEAAGDGDDPVHVVLPREEVGGALIGLAGPA